MQFYKFIEEIKEEITSYFNDDTQVTVNTVKKNNGVSLKGLVIKEKGLNISPTIYLNCFYERFLAGMKMEEILEEIYLTYQKCRQKPMEGIDFFSDYERVKERIVYKLIHAERNKELLRNIPYIPYLDMAIVFYCVFFHEDYGNGTILVYNNHMAMWKSNIDELYNYAKKNTPVLLPYYLAPMETVIHDLYEEEIDGNSQMDGNIERMFQIKNRDMQMYVLSNERKYFGAAAILYEDLLKNFGIASGRDFYVLPSSIHEVILVPINDERYLKGMSEMVSEINSSQVPLEEVLSDKAYYYDRKEGVLKIVGD